MYVLNYSQGPYLRLAEPNCSLSSETAAKKHSWWGLEEHTQRKKKKPTTCRVYHVLSKVQGLYSILPPYIISCKILRASKKGMLGREQMEFPPACMEESVSSATSVDTQLSLQVKKLIPYRVPLFSPCRLFFFFGCVHEGICLFALKKNKKTNCVHWQHLKDEENTHAT